MDQCDLTERESVLLSACAKVLTTQEENVMIRRTLSRGVDWPRLARQAVEGGVASLVGHTLVRVAPDLVPDDILDAFAIVIEQTRQDNSSLLGKLAAVMPTQQVTRVQQAVSRALAENPNDTAPWRTLGNALHRAGCYEEAIACFDRAIALAPADAASWRDRARVLLDSGQ